MWSAHRSTSWCSRSAPSPSARALRTAPPPNPNPEQVKNKAGQPKRRGTVRTKALRHSNCAARLQTLDGSAPVSIYTVSRELGHTSPAMVQRVHAHLGTIRRRAEVVEYRVEQHSEALGERLTALQRLGL